jgi:hypothetical protein
MFLSCAYIEFYICMTFHSMRSKGALTFLRLTCFHQDTTDRGLNSREVSCHGFFTFEENYALQRKCCIYIFTGMLTQRS